MVGSCGRSHGAWRGRARPRPLRYVLLLMAAGLCLLTAPAALASPSPTWSGQAESLEDEWSLPENWKGKSAPTEKEALGTLTFPRLSEPCEPEEHTCYESENDVKELSAESLHIDDGDGYEILGEALTLGSGGLTASPASGSSGPALDLLELPFNLSATQTWSVSGRGNGAINGLDLEEGSVTGATSTKLTVQLGQQAALYLAEKVEAGPVSIQGASATKPGFENGFADLEGAEVNSVDAEPVELSHILLFGSGEVGALTTKDAELAVGTGIKPAGGIEAKSATLDSGSEVRFEINGGEGVAQSDYSQLTSEGTVSLASAKLAVDVGVEKQPCPTLPTGQTYTFVSTTGKLSGAFANAPEHGADVPITFAKGCVATAQKIRISYNETGEPETVTGTVEVAPAVSEEPVAASVVEGEAATFKAAATGASEVQWQVKRGAGAFESDTTDAGNKTDMLTVEHTSASEGGDEYRALFKNGAGETPTTAAALTVKAKPVASEEPTATGSAGPAGSAGSGAPAGSGGVLSAKESSPDATIAGTSVTVGSSGKLVVKVSCPAGVASCKGTITLRTLTAVSAGAASHTANTKAAVVTLAGGSFSMTGGQSRSVTLTLTARARTLLARSHVLRTRATIIARDPEGGTHTTLTILTLRAAKAKRG